MRVLPIDQLDDPALTDFASLTDVALRRKLEPAGGLYLAEGEKVVQRALAAGHRPRAMLVQAKFLPQAERLLVGFPEIPVYVGADEVIAELTGFNVHRGVLASMHRPPLPSVEAFIASLPPRARIAVLEDLVDHTNVGGSELREPSPQVSGTQRRSRIAILDGLVDHTNVGACFRSAAAMGVDAVLVTPTCADPLYRRAIRVSMGTVFQVPWTRIGSWPSGADQLKAAGYVVAGMTLGEGSITLDDLVDEDHQNLALVFGTEGHGLSAQTEKVLDRRVTIPMMGGVDSLNVAASSAVAFYATRSTS